jgi:hypothetical protein
MRFVRVISSEQVLLFDFEVDGQTLHGKVSRECLEDHFGLASDDDETAWMNAFMKDRGRIQAKAVEKAKAGDVAPLVETADF